MYNPERKQAFLEQKKQKASISRNLETCFIQAEYFEKLYNRDIAAWNSTEIIDYYKWMNTTKIQTLIQLHTSLREYAAWNVLNGLNPDNQNHFDEINSETLCKCIDVSRLKQIIINRNELLDKIACLPNFADKYLVLAPFEGIGMRNDELVNARASDLNGNVIIINRNEFEVSDELAYFIRKTLDEDTYVSLANDSIEYQYYPCDTIIKPILRYGTTNHVSMNPKIMIQTRLKMIISYTGLTKNTTVKSLMESGRLDMIRNIISKYNISLDDALSSPYIEMHEKLYGKIQNKSTYKSTYGVLL